MSRPFEQYGKEWKEGTDPLKIEFWAIREQPNPLEHYKNAMRLLWPEDDWNRWDELCLVEMCRQRYLGIMGPGSSGKTERASKFALVDYWAHSQETCILISSTEGRGLELRVWGRIKGLFNRGKERFPWLAGHVLEMHKTITTDQLLSGENKARVLNKGIICIPCMSSGRWIGLGKYVGVKNKRVKLIADEASLMQSSFIDAIANLSHNPDFQAIFLGNPLDPMDPLGRVCEPLGGWTKFPDTGKTEVYSTRFMGGIAIVLNGLDSPNNDFQGPPRFPYLIHAGRIKEIAEFWGLDSYQYYSQAIGVMKLGLEGKRVITMQICREHHAFEDTTWASTNRTQIYSIDAAWSGTAGDRCVGGRAEFGENLDGVQILKIGKYKIIPVSVKVDKSPEDQIAEYVRDDILPDAWNKGVPVENVFYDSTGRGTLGSAFARVFGSVTPVPVEFGGKPSKRPVRHDLYKVDDKTGEKRLVRCDEYFFDFVSELWLESRYIIECDQIRGLPEEVALEGCAREYGRMGGNKYFVESKHSKEFRKKMAKSPDLYDWFVTLLEGARQRGFKIKRLGAILVEDHRLKWLEELANRNLRLAKSKMLSMK